MNNIGNLVKKATGQKHNQELQNAAFTDDLVKKFQDMVFGYIYALMRSVSVAEDLVQEVFIKAYNNNLENLKIYEAFPGWIKQIARRECIRYNRAGGADILSEDLINRMVSPYAGPQIPAEREEVKNDVQKAIALLPENQRIPTVLYYINGYIIEQMLADGIDVNKQDAAGKTLLHWAVENNHAEAVALLVRNGACKDIKDNSGKNAVQIASAAGNMAILKLLDSK